MALPGRQVYRPVHRPGQPWTAAAARAGQLFRARPGPRRADPHPARRADLEGPVGADVPALRVPAGQLLVQLGQMAGEVDLADAAGTWPDRDQVSVRAAGTDREHRQELRRDDPVLVGTLRAGLRDALSRRSRPATAR